MGPPKESRTGMVDEGRSTQITQALNQGVTVWLEPAY